MRVRTPRLAAGDFPPGAMAPLDDVVKVPLRAIVLGVIPRGDAAPLFLAATEGDAGAPDRFITACAVKVQVRSFLRDEDLRLALVRGEENGGVDLAALPVSSIAMSASLLRDAVPRVVALLGRSRGQEVVVAREATQISQLAGKRIGVEPRSASWYFLLWTLSRGGFSLKDVTLVPLDSTFRGAQALLAGQVDAVAGFAGDLAPTIREIGSKVLSSTADAPNLIAIVLTARGDFAARFPDGIRRVVRCALDANAAALKDPTEAARALGNAAAQLGDPAEAMNASPPSTLAENLAFFGLAEDSPVTFKELFQSASALNAKLFDAPPAPQPEDLLDLSALKQLSRTGQR